MQANGFLYTAYVLTRLHALASTNKEAKVSLEFFGLPETERGVAILFCTIGITVLGLLCHYALERAAFLIDRISDKELATAYAHHPSILTVKLHAPRLLGAVLPGILLPASILYLERPNITYWYAWVLVMQSIPYFFIARRLWRPIDGSKKDKAFDD